MNKWLELLAGVILLCIAAVAWISNWHSLGTAAWMFLKGGVVWLVILIGLLFLALGISDLRE
jgi:membrane protein YdbS with pleckstrin-like domain